MSYGQEIKTSSIISFKPEFRLNAIIPNNFGDNYLAKANQSNIGIGANINFLDFRHFQLGMGYDFISYSVTDVTKAGNIESSRYNSVYGILGYESQLSDKFYLQPYLGFGSVKLNFKSDDRSFGHQTGNNFRIGFNLDYKLDKTICIFAGLSYISNNYDIKTAPEYISFYDNSKMLQINIGIKLKFTHN